ncbi:hypothetical protein QR680_004607 [Steinernema hermaphroditum]|uniref:Vacuolar protein sorting-associated protein 33A n=1 Tax=Steinernema hermaphroditum TaxID=289476 RepID=A0AA39HP86_9BILA|nr:hypothetical protein QR680_004607 [Steinernema hermaphroditum]
MASRQRGFAGLISNHNRSVLFSVLADVPGEKAIIWDEPLIRRFHTVATNSELQEEGVVQNSKLNAKALDYIRQLVFIIQDTRKTQLKLQSYFTALDEGHSIYVYVVPRVSQKLLEWIKSLRHTVKHLAGTLRFVRSIPIYGFSAPHQSPDVVTMHVDDVIPRVQRNCWSTLHRCAEAVLELKLMMPRRPKVLCYGKWSKLVANIVESRRSEEEDVHDPGNSEQDSRFAFDEVVIIDRRLDLLTPLIFQRTHGGAIDELYGYSDDGVNQFEEAKFALEPQAKGEVSVSFNKPTFEELRDETIVSFGTKVQEMVANLKTRQALKDTIKSSMELRYFTSYELPRIIEERKLLSHQTRLAEMIQTKLHSDFMHDYLLCECDILEKPRDVVIPFIEDSIIAAEDIVFVIRLICLQSHMVNGLRQETLNAYRKLLVDSYGYTAVCWMVKLQDAGILKAAEQSSISSFLSRLSIGKADGLPDGWESELVNQVRQSRVDSDVGDARATGSYKTLLFVIGGLTVTEVGKLRLEFPDLDAIYVTNLTTGSDLITSFIDC